jgi:hypothetical protein
LIFVSAHELPPPKADGVSDCKKQLELLNILVVHILVLDLDSEKRCRAAG